jgi:hypothetical protein
MLRDGPIPRFFHGLIEYVAGGIAIAAPFVLSFDSGAAKAVAIVVGVLVIVLAATTDGPTSLVNSVPLSVHVLVDYLTVAILIASPFVFGFSDEGAPTAFFIVVGVLHLLITIGTRFRGPKEPAEPKRS